MQSARYCACGSDHPLTLVIRAAVPLAIALMQALGAPLATAAALDDQLTGAATDDIGKFAALEKAALVLGRTTCRENCVGCHGVDLKGVAGKHAPDLSERAT